MSQRCHALCTSVTRAFTMDLAIYAASRRLSSTVNIAELDPSAARVLVVNPHTGLRDILRKIRRVLCVYVPW